MSSFLSWSGFFRSLQRNGPPTEPDGLEAFAAEREAAPSARPAATVPGRAHRWTIGALAAVALVEAPIAGLWLYERSQPDPVASIPMPPQPAIQPGALVVAPVVFESLDALAPGHAAAASIPSPSRPSRDEPERASASLTVGGWVSVKTPVAMQVFEEGQLVGTTDIDRIMLPVGSHRLEIVSEALGYRSRLDVAVRSGQTSTVRLDLPTGVLAVNAQPWAEVWVDGERVGETPIGNLTRTIGPHEVVFRHPDLGERKTTVVVTLKAPARVGVDLRSKS
jgi:hypothetical protein